MRNEDPHLTTPVTMPALHHTQTDPRDRVELVVGPVALVLSITIGTVVLAGSFAALSEWFENKRRDAPRSSAPRLK
jgi:hypothetical protein